MQEKQEEVVEEAKIDSEEVDKIARTISVKGLPRGYPILELEDMFNQCGSIEKVIIGIDEAKITYKDIVALQLTEAFHEYDIKNYLDTGKDYILLVEDATNLEVKIEDKNLNKQEQDFVEQIKKD